MSNEILNIKDLTLEIGDTKILNGVSFTVNKGDIISIIGSSGSGKTSLIRCLNLLNYPSSGSIDYKGENILDNKYNVNTLRTNVVMVFQNFNLFNQMTVLENMILAPIKVLKMKKQDAIDKAHKMLALVNMEKFIKRPVEVLSGGQKQRVAIARALMMNPEVLLFDEPTSALDPEMVDEVLNVIYNLKDTGITMIIVSHEMSFVKKIATRIIFMQNGYILYDDTKDNLLEKMPEELNKFLNQKKD